jgi:hypothetical protein
MNQATVEQLKLMASIVVTARDKHLEVGPTTSYGKNEFSCHAVMQASDSINGWDDWKRTPEVAFIQTDIKQEINGLYTVGSFLESQGHVNTFEAAYEFRRKMLTKLADKYIRLLSVKPAPVAVKPSELARAAVTELLSNENLRGRTYTCSALTFAARRAEYASRPGLHEAVDAVKVEIAKIMGVDVRQLGSRAFEVTLMDVLGAEYVTQQGEMWVQERRKDMLNRIAKQFEREGR